MAFTPVTAESLVRDPAQPLTTPTPVVATSIAGEPLGIHGNNWPSRNPKALALFFGRLEFDLEGQPREQWVNRFTTRFDPPWPCVAPWDETYPVRAIRVHTAVAPSLHRILGRLVTEYGQAFARQQSLHLLAPHSFGLQPGQGQLTPESFGAAITFNPGAGQALADVGNPFEEASQAREVANSAQEAIRNAEAARERLNTYDPATVAGAAVVAAQKVVDEAAEAVELAQAAEKEAKDAKAKKEAKKATDAALEHVSAAEQALADAVAADERARVPAQKMAEERVKSAYRLATEAEERAQALELSAREAQAKGLDSWTPPSVVIDAFRAEGWQWAGPERPGTFFATAD